MSVHLQIMAKRIPAGIRKHIIDEQLIDKATNNQESKPFEYLFDVFEEFIDAAGEHDDWSCFKCREAVFKKMHELKPFIEQLNNSDARQ